MEEQSLRAKTPVTRAVSGTASRGSCYDNELFTGQMSQQSSEARGFGGGLRRSTNHSAESQMFRHEHELGDRRKSTETSTDSQRSVSQAGIAAGSANNSLNRTLVRNGSADGSSYTGFKDLDLVYMSEHPLYQLTKDIGTLKYGTLIRCLGMKPPVALQPRSQAQGSQPSSPVTQAEPNSTSSSSASSANTDGLVRIYVEKLNVLQYTQPTDFFNQKRLSTGDLNNSLEWLQGKRSKQQIRVGDILRVDPAELELGSRECLEIPCCDESDIGASKWQLCFVSSLRQTLNYLFFPLTLSADFLLILEVYWNRKESPVFFSFGATLLVAPLVVISLTTCFVTRQMRRAHEYELMYQQGRMNTERLRQVKNQSVMLNTKKKKRNSNEQKQPLIAQPRSDSSLSSSTVFGGYSYNSNMNSFTDRLTDCCLMIPLFNIVALANINAMMFKMFGTLICVVSTFPLYILNMSYILNKEDSHLSNVRFFNSFQLIVAVLILCFNPIYNITSVIFKQTNIRQGRRISLIGKIKAYSVVFLLFAPMTLIEMIGMFPILFAYLKNDSITRVEMIVLCIWFNLWKMLFVFHMLRKVWTSSGTTGITWLVLSLLTVVLFTVSPLVPYILIMLSKYDGSLFDRGICSSNAKYFWNTCLYLVFAYGGSLSYLLMYGRDGDTDRRNETVTGSVVIVGSSSILIISILASSKIFVRTLNSVR